ncbi:ubiquitin-conjugating enzyme E2-binding protein [Hypoxylon crocopeplum]|nr:ubiquitin-conjugating enzyme E2-binding protein [Hypoxylon crocopeplum]
MGVSPPILIYAELLSNIRQVSVGCSLHTPSTSGTKATVSSDGRVLTVNHDGVETSIHLPGRVASPPRLPLQNLGTESLSWRLPLATPLEDRVLTVSEEQMVPWSAGDLQPESPISCRTCHTAIVKDGLIKIWKDLPSENWAEMMEFWHCHKPHDHGHKHDDDGLTSRGYGANSRITAQPGVGFVDLTSFLLSCTDISTSVTRFLPLSKPQDEANGYDETHKNGESHTLRAESLPLFCKSCESQLGVLNDQGSSASLFKWQVYVDEHAQQGTSAPPELSHCISAMLLATMARSGCSKSIVMPMKVQTQPDEGIQPANGKSQPQSLLNIWVFNSNITFSSTEETRSPIHAVKVFYRMVSQDEADKLLDSMTSDVQDITLPADAIRKVVDMLSSSNHLLSQSDRQFQEWTVGLLEKWDGKGLKATHIVEAS